MKRGEIYFVDLEPGLGHEAKGRRPVLIVTSDVYNTKPLVVTVVVGTAARNVPDEYLSNVRVTAAETGLRIDTVFLCFQIRALDHSRFHDARGKPVAPAGVMPAAKMAEVERALRLVLDVED